MYKKKPKDRKLYSIKLMPFPSIGTPTVLSGAAKTLGHKFFNLSPAILQAHKQEREKNII